MKLTVKSMQPVCFRLISGGTGNHKLRITNIFRIIPEDHSDDLLSIYVLV